MEHLTPNSTKTTMAVSLSLEISVLQYVEERGKNGGQVGNLPHPSVLHAKVLSEKIIQIPLYQFSCYIENIILNFDFFLLSQNYSVNTDHCNNNVKDSDETDVDCGGVSCDACTNGG